MVLLSLVGLNNGQEEFGSCDYRQDIDAGEEYYVYNTNYPQNYEPGSSCRWVATSDQPIKLSCTLSLPTSPECSQDALIIQNETTESHRYCGNRTIDLVSTSNQFTLTLISSRTSTGGKFLCSLKTVESPDDSDCQCGWKNPMRIVGGTEIGINEYPMMSALADTQSQNIFCGATIINEIQVLTAAHCVKDRSMSNVGVLVGEHDVTTGAETNATKLFRVGNSTIHPLYNNFYTYDIAVVTIVGKITFDQQVGPVCLPFQHSSDTFDGSIVEVLGWGLTGFGGSKATTLQKAQLSVLTNAECSQIYTNVSKKQLCTYAPNRDSCQMDGGGPVLWQNPISRRLVEIGIISSGIGCTSDEPAINTRVGAFIEWIVRQTPPGEII